MYRFTLEKYSGSGSRHTCPACNAKKRFTRYVDTETGQYVSDHVGRCDRESKCGYHLSWKKYFADNPSSKSEYCRFIGTFPTKGKTGISWQDRKREKVRKPDFIDKRYLIESLSNYEQNAFVKFLFDLFPLDAADVFAAVNEYKIGTKDGFTIFPYIDQKMRVCKGKALKFGSDGHRLKNGYTRTSFEYLLFGKSDFESNKRILFGEHLLSKYPGRAIAIVEAEKTAVIASLCKRVFPDLVWLACGGLSQLNIEKLQRVGRGESILLFPDANGFDKWQGIASEARKRGIDVHISNLLETLATSDQKAKGLDLADYLIDEQQRRNDPANQDAFQDLIEERIAIMTIDGRFREADAESYLETSGFVEYAESRVLASA